MNGILFTNISNDHPGDLPLSRNLRICIAIEGIREAKNHKKKIDKIPPLIDDPSEMVIHRPRTIITQSWTKQYSKKSTLLVLPEKLNEFFQAAI